MFNENPTSKAAVAPIRQQKTQGNMGRAVNQSHCLLNSFRNILFFFCFTITLARTIYQWSNNTLHMYRLEDASKVSLDVRRIALGVDEFGRRSRESDRPGVSSMCRCLTGSWGDRRVHWQFGRLIHCSAPWCRKGVKCNVRQNYALRRRHVGCVSCRKAEPTHSAADSTGESPLVVVVLQ